MLSCYYSKLVSYQLELHYERVVLVKKMKKMIAIVVVCVLLSSMGGAFAAEFETTQNIPVTPFYLYAKSVSASLSFSGTTAKCNSTITGTSSVSSMKATLTLSRVNDNGTLTYINSWNFSNSNSIQLACNSTASVTKGYTYQLDVSAVVTKNGESETITGSAVATC